MTILSLLLYALNRYLQWWGQWRSAALTGLRAVLCLGTFACIQSAWSLKHTSLRWLLWTGIKLKIKINPKKNNQPNKRKHNTHAPHHRYHLCRRRSLILSAREFVSVTKFLCRFSVAQFTLPGLLARQASHLACCPPGFTPASPIPAPLLPLPAQGCSLGSPKHLFCWNLVLSLIRMK